MIFCGCIARTLCSCLEDWDIYLEGMSLSISDMDGAESFLEVTAEKTNLLPWLHDYNELRENLKRKLCITEKHYFESDDSVDESLRKEVEIDFK